MLGSNARPGRDDAALHDWWQRHGALSPPDPGAAPKPRPPSVFGPLRGASGTSLVTGKAVLTAFSHAIEDECRDAPGQAHLFGSFDRIEFYEPARATWVELAASARSAYVFADFETTREPGPGRPSEIAVDPESTMRREWVVVVDRPVGAVALTARERPDQEGVSDRHRLFDSAWTTDPVAVRKAARICALAANAAGSSRAAAVLYELSLPLAGDAPDPGLSTRLPDRLLPLIDG